MDEIDRIRLQVTEDCRAQTSCAETILTIVLMVLGYGIVLALAISYILVILSSS